MPLVVVPAYNEAAHIGRVIRGLFEHGFHEVLVVDDGSKDGTAKLAREAGARVVSHPINRGQGAALETGNAYARARGFDIVVHFDADLQFNPGDIVPAIKAMQAHSADVLFGSRFLDNRSQIPAFKKQVVLPLARIMNRLLTGLRLTDGQNGFRILGKNALARIRIRQDGMAHNTELTQQVARYGLSFIEFPVQVVYHEYGQRLSGGFKIIVDLCLAVLFN